MAARMAMTAITTSNSMSVNAGPAISLPGQATRQDHFPGQRSERNFWGKFTDLIYPRSLLASQPPKTVVVEPNPARNLHAFATAKEFQGRLGSGSDVQLGVDMAKMPRHGLDADGKLLGNLLVGATL